jgi:hypothetical protein
LPRLALNTIPALTAHRFSSARYVLAATAGHYFAQRNRIPIVTEPAIRRDFRSRD